MNIEVSEEKYWKVLNYTDGILYCSMLEIGGKDDWRMISEEDICGSMITEDDLTMIRNRVNKKMRTDGVWFNNDNHVYNDTVLNARCHVIPVRDV
jgi:hypothetical protein